MTTKLQQGSGIPGFKKCVRRGLINERVYRHIEVSVESFTIDSGADLSSQAFFSEYVAYGDSVYWNFLESGQDEGYFDATIIDDDDDPARYSYEYAPNRPLPAGLYTTALSYQFPEDMPCGFRRASPFETQVTAEAPAGTLHEAFFDPVTVGTAVKADGSNGVLKPTSFTVGSTTTDLTSLEWSNNKVVLTLDPRVSLGNHFLDFIELDGSVALSLFTDSATVDSTAGTYSWPMASQPWADGNKLMLRIREDT